MSIKQHGGVFGRNPDFNTIGGTLTTAAQPNVTSLGTQTSSLAFASGTGIDFAASAGGSTGANILGDYEEGTFTPVINQGFNSPRSYSTQDGRYVKIGSEVFFELFLYLASGQTRNADLLIIGGLPFTRFTTANNGGCSLTTGVGIVDVTEHLPYLFLGGASPTVSFRKSDQSNFAGNDLSGARPQIYISGKYRAA
jgi:hypothetical protein